MKRVSYILSLLMILSLLLSACAGVAPSAPAASSGADAAAVTTSGEGVTLTYMASQGWIQDAELELAQKFEEETGHSRRLPDHPGRPVFQRAQN